MREVEMLKGKTLVDLSGLTQIPGALPCYGTAAGLDFELEKRQFVIFEEVKAEFEVLLIEKL